MTAPVYTLEAWRRLRAGGAPPLKTVEEDVLPDVHTQMPDATLCVWHDEQWISFQQWLATHPIDSEPSLEPNLPDARCISAQCGNTRVWLVRRGGRYLIFAGNRPKRIRPFATPWRDHARRTAEERFGSPARPWTPAKFPKRSVKKTKEIEHASV